MTTGVVGQSSRASRQARGATAGRGGRGRPAATGDLLGRASNRESSMRSSTSVAAARRRGRAARPRAGCPAAERRGARGGSTPRRRARRAASEARARRRQRTRRFWASAASQPADRVRQDVGHPVEPLGPLARTRRREVTGTRAREVAPRDAFGRLTGGLDGCEDTARHERATTRATRTAATNPTARAIRSWSSARSIALASWTK